MGKLVHFSHSCPLTSPEIICDGICNICFKEEPIQFTCKPCNFDLCDGCFKLPQKVNDTIHNHVMRAVDMGELRYEERCGICKRIIFGNPWRCETCRFFAHNYCVDLGKPSRHRFHWNHSLTLLPRPLSRDMMSCDSCREDIKGFHLFCRIRSFLIHVICAIKGTRFLGIEGPKVVGIWKGRCLKGKHRMVQAMFSKSNQIVCDICFERLCGKAVSCMECQRVYHLPCFERRALENRIVYSDDSS